MIYYNKGGNMIGRLAKWIHDYEPTNLCVVLELITEQPEPEGSTVEQERLYLLYDFITNEQFYALESEIAFI